MAEDESRKRSRFEVGEADPAPAPKSRFDRRSRSPAPREQPDRYRSPSRKTESPANGAEQTAKQRAMEVAQRINANLAAKKEKLLAERAPQEMPAGLIVSIIHPLQVSEQVSAQVSAERVVMKVANNMLPGYETYSNSTTAPDSAKSPSQPASTSGPLNNEVYQQDGDFIRDIEINDLRNRYTLTKGSTQKMIKEKTGADVTTRGSYYPDKAMATAVNPPLYLHITSTSKEKLEQAVDLIDELMKQELPNLIDERRFGRNRREQPEEQQQERPRRKWPEERIPIDLEPIRGFNLRAQVVGTGGSYVKHVQSETGCRVQIKGRGSGFIEHDTGVESDEQMYLHVAGPDPDMVEAAKRLCESLLDNVREGYEAFKAAPQLPPRGSYGNDRGGYHRGGDRGGDRHNGGSYGGNSYGGNSYGGNSYGGSSHGGNSSYGGDNNAYSSDNHGHSSGNNGYAGVNTDYAAAYTNPAYDQNQAYGAAHPSAPPQQPADPAEQQQQYEQWAAYYALNPLEDPYREFGGYAAIVAQYMQSGHQQPAAAYAGTPGAGQAAVAAPPPPPPDMDQATHSQTQGGYHAVPPPPPPPPGN